MPLDFPSNPVDGQVYDNYYYDADMGTWRGYGVITPVTPPGIISQYAGSTAPSGYLMCDGQSLTTAAYPALFQAIGYQYGGTGANFNIPNLQNRVPVGKGADVEFDTLGETGGAKTHTLTVSEMPSHTHTQDAHNHTQNEHGHGGRTESTQSAPTGFNGISSALRASNSAYTLENQYMTPTTATNNPATATNQNTGGGLAHNNLQPYIVLNYIIKT